MLNNDAVKNVIKFLRPHRAVGYKKIRIGGDHDGGYICIDDFRDIKFAISGGVGYDDRWEMEIARERKIPMIAFDCGIPCDMKAVPSLPYKLFAGKMEAYPSTRNSILDCLLLPYKDNEVICKIDIEGDEWDILGYTQTSTYKKIRQLIVEFHLDVTNENKSFGLDTLAKYGNVFERLYRTFRVVHIHGNNNLTPCNFENLQIPRAFEITFANINYYNLVESNEIFPTELDMPCTTDREEIYLGTFSL